MYPCYTIHDLSELTGFSVRAIRKYITNGLVPHSISSDFPTQAMRYGEDHLRALKQIREIKDQNMTIRDIYDRLNPYTGEEDSVFA